MKKWVFLGICVYCKLLLSDPVLRLDFRDSKGATTFRDGSGNGYDFTCSGGACPTLNYNGKFNRYISFDGGDVTESAHTPALDISGTSHISISFWFRTSTNPAATKFFVPFMMTETGDNSALWDKGVRVNSSGKPTMYVYDGASKEAVGSTTVTNGNWHHLVGVYDGTNAIIYVNGASEDTVAATSTYDFTSPQPVMSYINSDNINVRMTADIRNVKVWDSTVSRRRVALLYQRATNELPYRLAHFQIPKLLRNVFQL